MSQFFSRRSLLHALSLGGVSCLAGALFAQEKRNLKEPVLVVTRPEIAMRKEHHVLDPALQIARESLEYIQRTVKDYQCTLVKRERIGNELHDYEYMDASIRNRKVENGRITTPLSVYIKFRKPDSVAGREVLWVEGQNNNKLLAHEGGRIGAFTPAVWLAPEGAVAMRGNRYPLSEVGIENLVKKLIEKGERDRNRDECEVQFFKDAKINGRPCTLLEVKHPVARDYFDFHIAQIYIDTEYNVPIRYAAYTWPEAGSDKPVLLEEYTYLKLKLNVGLTDNDFSERNKNYGFH
jgi:Protein of unknown function (DUF1571)